jgi:hypothetical protein
MQYVYLWCVLLLSTYRCVEFICDILIYLWYFNLLSFILTLVIERRSVVFVLLSLIYLFNLLHTLVKIYWLPIIPIIGKKSWRIDGHRVLPIMPNYCNNIGTNNCLLPWENLNYARPPLGTCPSVWFIGFICVVSRHDIQVSFSNLIQINLINWFRKFNLWLRVVDFCVINFNLFMCCHVLL